MSKSYICNAFSLQMVGEVAEISKIPATVSEIPADAVNCVGHEDTAVVIGGILRKEMHANRVNVHLDPGDTAWVFQVIGGRLPEGATTLPEGMTLKLYRVTVH